MEEATESPSQLPDLRVINLEDDQEQQKGAEEELNCENESKEVWKQDIVKLFNKYLKYWKMYPHTWPADILCIT